MPFLLVFISWSAVGALAWAVRMLPPNAGLGLWGALAAVAASAGIASFWHVVGDVAWPFWGTLVGLVGVLPPCLLILGLRSVRRRAEGPAFTVLALACAAGLVAIAMFVALALSVASRGGGGGIG